MPALDDPGDALPSSRPLSRFIAAWWRPLLLVFVILAAAVATRHALGDAWTVAGVRGLVSDAGAWGAAGFVVAAIALTVLLFPGTPTTLIAGFLFGPVYGVLYGWVAMSGGALIAYELGRSGRGPMPDLIETRFKRTAALLADKTLGTVFVARLIPVAPFTVLNYAFGMAGVPRWEYAWGTIFGVLPVTAAYVLFGAAAYAIGEAGSWTAVNAPEFYVPFFVAILLTAAGFVAARRLSRRVPVVVAESGGR